MSLNTDSACPEIQIPEGPYIIIGSGTSHVGDGWVGGGGACGAQ